MPVQVSEQEYKVLSGAKQLLDNVMSHPKARLVGEQAIKMVHPSAVTTADRVAPFVNAINQIGNEVKALRQEKVDDAAKAKLDAGYDHLRRVRHYTDDGIKKVQEFMVAEGIASPVTAADAWERRNPKPAPQTPGYTNNAWTFLDSSDEDDKELWSNTDRWTDKMIGKVLKEYQHSQADDY